MPRSRRSRWLVSMFCLAGAAHRSRGAVHGRWPAPGVCAGAGADGMKYSVCRRQASSLVRPRPLQPPPSRGTGIWYQVSSAADRWIPPRSVSISLPLRERGRGGRRRHCARTFTLNPNPARGGLVRPCLPPCRSIRAARARVREPLQVVQAALITGAGSGEGHETAASGADACVLPRLPECIV